MIKFFGGSIMNEEINATFAPILIVEDEEDHARLIIRALVETGKMMNEIVHIDNGLDALNYLKRKGEFKENKHHIPALILLDVKMPMKNGFEVLEELKADENLKKIPVVMLTTTSTSEDIDRAMGLGANDYIVKPIKFIDFTEKVGKLGYYWGMVSDARKIFG
jgi:two-component system, response regulator